MLSPPDVDAHRSSLADAARAVGLDIGELVLPERRSVLVGEHRLNLFDWGGPGPDSIVFLHGAGLTARTWDLTCLAVRDRYHCLAVDLRGHGDSEWSPAGEYSAFHIATDIATLLDGLADPPVLVGHSLGGLAAAVCATHLDVEIRGLVLVDIGPSTTERRPRGDRQDRSEPRAPRPPLVFDSFDEFVDHAQALNPRRDRDQLQVSLTHNARPLPDGRWTWKYDQRHFGMGGQRPDPTAIARLWERIDDLGAPLLVVRGSESRVLDATDAAALAERVGDGRWVEVPDAGHTVHGDNPAAFIGALTRFLDHISHHDAKEPT